MISSQFVDCFGDKRLDVRGSDLRRSLFSNATRSILALSSSRAEQKAFYRFLENQKTDESILINEMQTRCAERVKDRIVLCIQDSTEINLSRHKGRLRGDSENPMGNGVGDINDNFGTGFFIHPSLVVDAANAFPIGFSSMLLWNRPSDMASKVDRRYKELPPDAKESYKWTQSTLESREVLDAARAIIIVQDREGDIFNQFVQISDPKTFFLIRSRTDRATVEGETLWEKLANAPSCGTYELEVPASKTQPARTARMNVRICGAKVKCPEREKVWLSTEDATTQLYAIEAKEEVPPGSPAISEPLCWRLLTNWPVETLEDALLLIEWYSWRWMIEEMFRMLKKEGFNIEASELGSGWSIRKLAVLIQDVIIKLMQMHIAYNEPEGENPNAGLVFSEPECLYLEAVEKKLEGKTQKLRNPFQQGELRWAVWIIARIGGWKGYSSQQPPGMTTLFRGLAKFTDQFDGWSIAKDVGTR